MRCAAGLALVACLVSPSSLVDLRADAQRDAALKAAYIFNFAKYTEWPALPAGARLTACVYGDEAIASALEETVRGQHAGGHPIDVRPVKDVSTFPLCHLLFVGAAEMRRSPLALHGVSALPVLTVSDGSGFSKSGGIIEMYVEDGRIHFAINVTSVERAGLVVSSRLLGLARIVRGRDVP